MVQFLNLLPKCQLKTWPEIQFKKSSISYNNSTIKFYILNNKKWLLKNQEFKLGENYLVNSHFKEIMLSPEKMSLKPTLPTTTKLSKIIQEEKLCTLNKLINGKILTEPGNKIVMLNNKIMIQPLPLELLILKF